MKHLRKIFSTLLSLSVLASLSVPAFASEFNCNEEFLTGVCQEEYLEIGNETIKYEYENNLAQRITTVTYENGTKDIFRYDIEANILYMNGEALEVETVPVVTSFGWVEYQVTTGKLDIKNMALSAAVGAISAATGIAGGAFTGAIAVLISNNTPEIWVSWKTKHYYWDPVVTSRPRIQKLTNLYSGEKFNNLIYGEW